MLVSYRRPDAHSVLRKSLLEMMGGWIRYQLRRLSHGLFPNHLNKISFPAFRTTDFNAVVVGHVNPSAVLHVAFCRIITKKHRLTALRLREFPFVFMSASGADLLSFKLKRHGSFLSHIFPCPLLPRSFDIPASNRYRRGYVVGCWLAAADAAFYFHLNIL